MLNDSSKSSTVAYKRVAYKIKIVYQKDVYEHFDLFILVSSGKMSQNIVFWGCKLTFETGLQELAFE